MESTYTVEMEPRAAKDLRSVPTRDQVRVLDRIASLADDPRPHGSEKLVGMTDAYRVRQGDYRIVYTIDEAVRIVTITRVGHRRDVYRRR